MTSEERFAANLARFEKDFPDIAHQVSSIHRPLSSIVYEDRRPDNIHLGPAGRLYPRPAHEEVREQIDAYRQSARRILMTQVFGAGLSSAVAMRMLHRMQQAALSRGHGSLELTPRTRASFLIVMGIGLGLHLPDLVREIDVQVIILIEPFVEFIRHSMHVVDWNALLYECERRDKRVVILNSGDIDVVAKQIDILFGDRRYPALDGSYVFIHYPSWLFQEVDKRIAQLARQRAIARGYIEDEVTMMRNASANLAAGRFRLLEPRKGRRIRPQPVFIVGSGPSIDRSIAFVEKWREHAVVFSCGTALQVLLSHGIVPDFHCELENGPQVPEVLAHVKSKYSFEGITLIASATVEPAVLGLFDRAILFLRDSVSSTFILNEGHDFLQGTAPTVSNTAMASALYMGFRQLYLFGVDCGSRDTADHSEHSVYNTMSSLKRPQFTMNVPGNFGGTVRTHWIFDLTRHMLEVAQAAFRPRLFNCSDGALIKGAIPKVPQALRFPGEPLKRQALIDELLADMPFYEPGEFFSEGRADELLKACERLEEEVRHMLEAMPEEDGSLLDISSRVVPLFARLDRELRVSRVMSASSVTMPRIAGFFINRIADEESRDELFREFLVEYTALLEEMLATTRESIAGAAKTIRGAPGWTASPA